MGRMADTYVLQLLLLTFSGWISRQQQHVLDYLIEENRVLKEQLKGKALRSNDDQRRRLAAKGKRIGRRLLMQVATIVTPDTILRWHRQLIRSLAGRSRTPSVPDEMVGDMPARSGVVAQIEQRPQIPRPHDLNARSRASPRPPARLTFAPEGDPR